MIVAGLSGRNGYPISFMRFTKTARDHDRNRTGGTIILLLDIIHTGEDRNT
ncbi:MAG: hypothetical protein HC887_06740 [Desulfobacteraceae bacterium]|nr:hypothetical protein [Desulfobacteraceae bacterium]